MKRKLLSIALALCMVLGMMPTALAEDIEISKLDSATFNNGSNYWLDNNWSGNISMADNATATFDLKGHTLSGDITVKSGTTLTIKDSSITEENPLGDGVVSGTVTVDGGTLNIQGGTYETGLRTGVILNSGKLNISGGDYENGISVKSGSCVITGGYFLSDSIKGYITSDCKMSTVSLSGRQGTRVSVVENPAVPATLTMDGWTYHPLNYGASSPMCTIEDGVDYDKAQITYKYKKTSDADTATNWKDEKPTDAGSYTVKATLPKTNDYKETVLTADFTIKPALVKVDNVYHNTKVYDGTSAADFHERWTTLVMADDPGSTPLLRDTNAPETERNKDWKTYSVTGVYVKSDKETEAVNVNEAMYLKYTVKLNEGANGNYAFDDGEGGYTYECTGYITEGIEQRPVKIEGTVADKAYDGTTTIGKKPTNVTVSSEQFDDDKEGIQEANTGLVGDETLSVIDTKVTSVEFEDEKVGGNKSVKVTGYYQLRDGTEGGKAENYYIYDTAITGNITAKALTVDEVQLWGKSYDRTTTAEVLEVKFGGLADGEELEAGVDYTVTANYVDANVSESAKAAAWTLTLKQTDKTKNYTLGEEGTAHGTIDNAGIIQKAQTNPIEITGSMAQPGGEGGIDIPLNLIVEGGTIALNTTDTVDADGILDGVTFENNHLHYTLKNTAEEAQTATIILTVTSPNYETYNIEVTVGVPEKGRLYIESVGDTLATAEYTGEPITDFDNATFTFEDENGEAVEVEPEKITIEYVGPTFEVTDEAPVTVGKYVAIVSVETDNYRGYEYFPFEIVAHELTVNVTANNKNYDGTTAATLGEATLVGAAEGDKVELDTSAVTAAFEDEEVGEGKKVVLTGEYKLTGEDAANYTVKQPTGLTADILPVSATDVKLDEVQDTTLKFDGQLQLKATLTPANATDTVTWSSSDEKVLKVSDKGLVTAVGYGTATITAKVGDKESKCTFTVVCTTEKTCLYYTDVPVDQWYHLSVDYVTAKGIMQGEGNKTFKPEVTLTRAELATILYNYEKKIVNGGVEPVRGEANTKFSDVKDGEWYEDAIKWAASHKIVLGDGEADGNTFRPDDSVSREEMVTMLHRYVVEYLKEDFSDVTATGDWTKFSDYKTVADWAQESFEWAVKYGIINGDDGNKLNPQNTATRAQAAKIMMVASELMK